MSNLLVQNIKHTNGTTAQTVDSSGGVAVAGTLAVTGVHTVGNNAIYTSEGGAVTQNLVQGLCKAWSYYTSASSFTNHDSFNVSSLTDRGAGDCRLVFTNVMASVNRPQYGQVAHYHYMDGDSSASYANFVSADQNHSAVDSSRTSGMVGGDLA